MTFVIQLEINLRLNTFFFIDTVLEAYAERNSLNFHSAKTN